MGERAGRGGTTSRGRDRSGIVVDRRGVIAYSMVAIGFLAVAFAVDNLGVRIVFLLAAGAVALFAAGWAGLGPLKRTRR